MFCICVPSRSTPCLSSHFLSPVGSHIKSTWLPVGTGNQLCGNIKPTTECVIGLLGAIHVWCRLSFVITLHLSIIIEMAYPVHSPTIRYLCISVSLGMLVNGSSGISLIPSHPMRQFLRSLTIIWPLTWQWSLYFMAECKNFKCKRVLHIWEGFKCAHMCSIVRQITVSLILWDRFGHSHMVAYNVLSLSLKHGWVFLKGVDGSKGNKPSGFLNFIADGLRPGVKWRDGARGGRYG